MKGRAANIDEKILRKLTERSHFFVVIISKRTGMKMDKLLAMDVFKRMEAMEKKRQESATAMAKWRTQLVDLDEKWRERDGRKRSD